jgi:Na+-transporting NADH:ubiquinone oxidoreductase subunit B
MPSTADLFLGRIRGSIGEPCSLALIAGGLFIILVKVASWRIVLSCLLSGAVFSLIMNRFGPLGDAGIPVFADPAYTLFSGGYMLSAFFMATDPVSAPVNKGAKWFYGGLIGVTAVFIRGIGGFPEGMMFSILLANVFAPLMEQIAIGIRYRRKAVPA